MSESGLSPAEIGTAGAAFVLALGASVVGYLRSFRKPAGKAEQAQIVAAALTSPDRTAAAIETLSRIEAHLEVGNRLTDEQTAVTRDGLRDVERAIRDHCASDERSAARAADALIRTADETRRLTDAVAGAILAKGK